jgi:hypothetical protein
VLVNVVLAETDEVKFAVISPVIRAGGVEEAGEEEKEEERAHI